MPCVFIKKSHFGFAIVAVYVDDMNLIGTPEELARTVVHLKLEFELKDLDAKRDPFHPNKDDEEILEPEGTTDLGLFYPYKSSNGVAAYAPRVDSRFVGYVDVGYLSDPHKARSQMSYVFTIRGTAISCRSTKQTLVATSSNHAEILALHQETRECFWLRAVVGHIRSLCDLYPAVDVPTMIFEDNAACIEQLKKGYIKGDNTKHIVPKFFFSQQHQITAEGDVSEACSWNWYA
ncbi:uncharacterized protein [Pyrus communis]|uniref:uncharacterized protein n=1 Tax=Pyrus communis TaxID=23211 RepID=UPI0035C1ACEB